MATSMAAPWFGPRGLPPAFVLAVLSCWPMFVSGAVFIFPDSTNYLDAGREIWATVADALRLQAPGPDAVVDQGAAASPRADKPWGPDYARSLPYSAVVWPVLMHGGPWALALLQGTLVVFTAFALLDDRALRRPAVLGFGALGVVVLSPLPWYTVMQMPDILGAVLLIWGAALVGPFDGMTRGQKAALTLIATFAAASHYGNMPLAFGIGLVVAALAAIRRSLSAAVVVSLAVVVVAPPVSNLIASRMVLDTTSAAPKRVPVLIARSIEDGPAIEYLDEACRDGADWEVCDAFRDGIPDRIDSFLWQEGGVRSLDEHAMQRIREQEVGLFLTVLRKHPLRQGWALLKNTGRQFVRIGVTEIEAVTGWPDGGWSAPRAPEADALVARFDVVVPIATGLAALALAGLWLAEGFPRPFRDGLVVVVLGLLGNAVIFGGLSAPVDRYQARIVWVVPILLVYALAARRRFAQVRLGT